MQKAERNSVNDLLVDISIPFSDIDLTEIVDKKAEGTYAKIPFGDIDKLQCRGRHLLATLWILRCMDSTCKRRTPWFYVDPTIVEYYNTNLKDWYKNIKKLATMGIIKVRQREGRNGRNLYCFTEKLVVEV